MKNKISILGVIGIISVFSSQLNAMSSSKLIQASRNIRRPALSSAGFNLVASFQFKQNILSKALPSENNGNSFGSRFLPHAAMALAGSSFFTRTAFAEETDESDKSKESMRDLELRLTIDVIYNRSKPIEKALQSGVPINGQVMHEVLYDAASRGKSEIVAMLLENGIDPNPLYENPPTRPVGLMKTTAIGAAAESGSYKAVKLFLDAGVDPDASLFPGGTTALNEAIVCISSYCSPNSEVVKLLLDFGADVKKLSESTLQFLPEYSNPLVIELLIKAGLDPNITIHGKTFLDRTIEGKTENLIAFVNNGADINKIDDQGRSYLFKTEDPALLEVLLKKGLDPNKKGKQGSYPISHMWLNGEAIKVLLSYGARPDQLDIRRYIVLKDPDLVELALKNEKNREKINMLGERKELLLHEAIHVNAPRKTVLLLLGAGAEVNGKEVSGWTALHKSFSQKYYLSSNLEKVIDISELLIKHGAEPSQDILGRTPLMVMCLGMDSHDHRHRLIDAFYTFEAEYYGVDPEIYKKQFFDYYLKGFVRDWTDSYWEPNQSAIKNFWGKMKVVDPEKWAKNAKI